MAEQTTEQSIMEAATVGVARSRLSEPGQRLRRTGLAVSGIPRR